MAFNFSKIEAVRFGDFEVVPKMDREQKLRAQSVKVTEDNLEEVQDVLSACFGVDAARVKEFMKANLFLQDYIQLQIYLTQGQRGLDSYNKRLDIAMEKEMDRALEKLHEEKEGEND